MKKITCITFSIMLFLSCSSCSSEKNTSKPSSTKTDSSTNVEEKESTILSSIHLYNGDLNDVLNTSVSTYDLYLNSANKSIYNFSCSTCGCEFSKEKGDEFFKKFQTYDMKEYEPYHANEDGIMVTEYEPYTVQTFNWIKTEDGKYIAEPTESGHFWVLSEASFNQLLNDFKELETVAQKSKQIVSQVVGN